MHQSTRFSQTSTILHIVYPLLRNGTATSLSSLYLHLSTAPALVPRIHISEYIISFIGSNFSYYHTSLVIIASIMLFVLLFTFISLTVAHIFVVRSGRTDANT
jgi:hypothetical protein